jgi:hypothetical protein
MVALFEKNASKHINASEVNAKCHLKDIFDKQIEEKMAVLAPDAAIYAKKQ